MTPEEARRAVLRCYVCEGKGMVLRLSEMREAWCATCEGTGSDPSRLAALELLLEERDKQATERACKAVQDWARAHEEMAAAKEADAPASAQAHMDEANVGYRYEAAIRRAAQEAGK